jgi:outer membrane biosynthesis protein TonB
MEFRTASVISVGLHAAVLLWALISFGSRPLEATPVDSLPVDIISDKDFSQMTKGAPDAPKAEKPKPQVQKIDEPKPVEDPTPKVTEKQEVKTQQEKQPPPQPQAKPDPIADKIKQQADQPPKQESKKEQPKEVKNQPKFDANKIAALLDKRDPQSKAATGAEMQAPTLGHVKGEAAQLSQSEIDALRTRLRQCWNPPVGASDASNLNVVFRVLFRRDGSIVNTALVGGTASESGPVLAESAIRALLQCQPYTMLRPEHFDTWKDMQITFDPHEMFGN